MRLLRYPDGNLQNFLQSNEIFALVQTTIYFAEIVHSIEYLHKHRRLPRSKAGKYFIASDKHIALADFFSARNIEKKNLYRDDLDFEHPKHSRHRFKLSGFEL